MIDTLKALADENRLRIFHILTQDELCVCELEVILEMSQSNVSRHLTKLKVVQLIQATKGGQWVHYKMNPHFEQLSPSLLYWLKSHWQNNEIFKQDLLRYRAYLESPYTCQNITAEREVVLSALKSRKV